MKKYSGIDLHSNNSVVVVTDETDRIIVEKRMPNDLSAIIDLLAPHRSELAGVVVESTYNWYWLVDGLEEAGYRVHLANTTAIKSYEGLKHSNDETDAAYLAHLLRLGILRTAHIYPKEQRATRDLARKRMQLTRSRTQHVLAVENIVARETAVSIKSNDVKRLTAESVLSLLPHVEGEAAIRCESLFRLTRLWRGAASQEGVWAGEPEKLNGCRVSPPDTVEIRIACIVSHQGTGTAVWVATKAVSFVWTRGGTNVFLGRHGRQGGRLQLATPLDPDG
jgi:transposase